MISPIRPIRFLAAAAALALVASCAAPKNDLKDPPAPLGRFLLGIHVVVTDGMQKSPVSRDATSQEWKDALQKALLARFGEPRYDGDKYYNISVKVLGYALAPGGIPVLLAPKSVLIIEVRFYDDAEQRQLTAEPKRFTVFEGTSGATIVGSGLIRSKKEQMSILSYNAVKKIEQWLVANPQWFPMTGDVPLDAVSPTDGTDPGGQDAATKAAAKAAEATLLGQSGGAAAKPAGGSSN